MNSNDKVMLFLSRRKDREETKYMGTLAVRLVNL